jgi:SAM-dependent methyltransferase
MRNNYSTKVRNKKKGRKTTTLVKRRHMKGGYVAKNVLFIGVGGTDATDYLRLKQGLIANEINFATDNIYLLDKNMELKDGFAPRDNIKGLIKYNLNDVDKIDPDFKFDDESNLFDIIIFDYGVYYFIDINKLKKFFDKWLKPGGYFLIPDIINNDKNAFAIKLPSIMPQRWDNDNILIEIPGGETLELPLHYNFTLGNYLAIMKVLIAEDGHLKFINPMNRLESLPINEPLSNYRAKVINNSKFKFIPIANSNEIQIFVQYGLDNTKPLQIYEAQYIGNIKRTILDYFNIPQEDLHLWRLSLAGKMLDDNKLVKDYHINTESTIHLMEVGRPRYSIKQLQQIFSSYNCQALSYNDTVRAPPWYEVYKLLKCTKNVYKEDDYSWPGGRKITKKSKKRKSKSKKQSKKK